MKAKQYVFPAMIAAIGLTLTGCGTAQSSGDATATLVTEAVESGSGAVADVAVDTEEAEAFVETEAAESTASGTLPAFTFEGDPLISAICDYLTTTIAADYEKADVSIPYLAIVDMDTSDDADTLVWGDFLVMNYNLNGDILETQSGGNYPGLMHLKKNDDGSYTVTAFDQVADGSDYEESAKEIFGDRYEDFSAIQSDNESMEEVRKVYIESYVEANGLNITAYQDYGWDPVELNQE